MNYATQITSAFAHKQSEMNECFSHTTLQNVLFPACNNTCIKHYVFIVLFSFVCSVADCHKALYYLFLPCLIIGLSLFVCFFLSLFFFFFYSLTPTLTFFGTTLFISHLFLLCLLPFYRSFLFFSILVLPTSWCGKLSFVM